MGTSKSFGSMKGNPQWPKLSRSMTMSCVGGDIPGPKVRGILSNYVATIGSASKATSGKSGGIGRAGIRTAGKIAAFIGAFESSGSNLAFALAETGLVDLKGKTAVDIINHLIEYCSGPSATIDDHAAKAASQALLEELARDAKSVVELQDMLKAALDEYTLEEILVRYFGYYIYEHLSTFFYEKLIKEKGKTKCFNLFKRIRGFIFERLKEINKKNPLKNVKWGTPQSAKLISKLQDDVLKVFA